MTRRAALCLFLLLGILVGLTLEPDSGTPASLGRPDVTGSTVGANHAKPLPRITTIDEIARVIVPSLVVILMLTSLMLVSAILRTTDEPGPRRSLLWARIPTRRGPPALALG